MRRNNRATVLDMVISTALVIIAALVGYAAGQHGLELDAYRRGYDTGYELGYEDGWNRGVEVQNIDLYATCEDRELAELYPAGFCEGVDAYLGL